MKNLYFNVNKISETELSKFNPFLTKPKVYCLIHTRYYFDEKSNTEKEERTFIKKDTKNKLIKEIAIKKIELGISGDKHYYHVNKLKPSVFYAIKIENGKVTEKYEVLKI